MKKISLLLVAAVLLFSACQQDPGYLGVTITATTPESIEADLASEGGEVLSISSVNVNKEVTFSVTVKEEEEFTRARWSIMDGRGMEIAVGTASEAALPMEFTHTFTKAENYSVKVYVYTGNDFGYGYYDIEAEVTMQTPEWSLTSKNENSFMAGDQAVFDVTDLNTAEVSSMDVRIVNADTNESIFFKKNSDGSVIVNSRPTDYGSYKMVITLYDANGNSITVEDQLIILNPKNPIKSLLYPTRNDPNYPDQIYVEGVIESPNPLVNIKLVRTAYYGREAGIEPLSEPPLSGVIDYNKVDQPLDVRTEEYIANAPGSPFIYDEMTQTFQFIDPMTYTDEVHNVESSGFKWDYAKFDREAWKYIKRKKHFDLERALSVDYQILATSDQAPEAVPSATVSGYPYLSTVPMSMLCMWLKEVAFNRIWLLQVPRFCWGKTSDWLKIGQSVKSADQKGFISYSVDILTQSGSGSLSNYSDWPGIKLHSPSGLNVAASLKTNVRQKHYLNGIVTTTIYPDVNFTIDNIGVRDYTLQWGFWKTEGKITGRLVLHRDGAAIEEIVTAEQLLEIMPTYEGWGPYPGYGYDNKDAASYMAANNTDVLPPTWTKINFKYPPTPDKEGWKFNPWSDANDTGWKMYYEVN